MPPLPEGAKFDQGKVRYDLLSPYFLEEMSWILTFGVEKYEDHNWAKGIKYSRILRALIGHIFSWMQGEQNDPETGRHHLAHAACCLMFLLHYEALGDQYRAYNDLPKWREISQ